MFQKSLSQKSDMRILYLVQSAPEWTGSGAAQRTYRLWRKLQTMGEVQVVCWDQLADKSIFAAVFRRLFRPAEWPWRLWRRTRPWNGTFDLVVTRYLNTAVRARAWEIAPCKVDVDDLPSMASRSVWSRSWPFGTRWIPRLVVRMWERYALRRLRGAWVANPADLAVVSRFCPCEVFANEALPPKSGYRATGRQKKKLLTVGGLDYPPNPEGVGWFIRKVWPQVRSRVPDVTYVVAGGGQIGDGKLVATPGVEFTGFVEDIDALYEEAKAVVVPVLSGAGTSIKVLEALSRERTVFATAFATRGLSAADMGRVVVCTSADEMARKLCDWLKANEGEDGGGV